jgi:predicted dehydrogenase
MERLRISVVGLGMAVEPHARSLVDLQDKVEVKWAATRSPARLAAFEKRFPFPGTTDVTRAIEDPDVDAVMLLTPPSSHLDLGLRCLESGKHLLIEKPLALDIRQASALVEAAERNGRRLGVVLQHRFRDAGRNVTALIESGAFGGVEAASLFMPWWRPQSYYDEPGRGTLARDGGGVLLTQAIHALDLFRSLFGVKDVLAAQAKTTSLHRMETEDFASALLTLGNGAPGSIVATTAAFPGRPERIEAIGSRGSLWIEGDSYAFHALDGTTQRSDAKTGSGAGSDPMAFANDAHRALLADFIDAMRENRPPRASGREALATQVLIEDILSAARRNASKS